MGIGCGGGLIYFVGGIITGFGATCGFGRLFNQICSVHSVAVIRELERKINFKYFLINIQFAYKWGWIYK